MVRTGVPAACNVAGRHTVVCTLSYVNEIRASAEAAATSHAAGKLQNLGLIHYSRGRITVLDRPGPEARACECYDVVKREFDRLLQEQAAR